MGVEFDEKNKSVSNPATLAYYCSMRRISEPSHIKIRRMTSCV